MTWWLGGEVGQVGHLEWLAAEWVVVLAVAAALLVIGAALGAGALGRRALPVSAAVADAESLARMADAVEGELGPVSILVNNAYCMCMLKGLIGVQRFQILPSFVLL